jgi:predicted Zn-dependent peptidase
LYRLETTASRIGQALGLLSAVLQNPALPPEAVAAEKDVVLREIAAHQRLPANRARRLLRATIWEDHALAHPIVGSAKTVRRIGRADVAAFLRENCTAERIVVAAAGAINHECLVSLTANAFGNVRRGSGVRRELPMWRSGCEQRPAATEVTHFCLGLPVAGYGDPESAFFDLMNRTAGATLCCRLNGSGALLSHPVIRVRADYLPYRDTGVFLVEGSARPCTSIKIRDRVLAEWETVVSGRWPADDAVRAAETERLSLWAACDADPFSVARRLAIRGSCGAVRPFSPVTPGELRDFVRQHQEKWIAQASLACVGPCDGERDAAAAGKVWVN